MYQWHEESLLYEWEVQSENLFDTIGDSLSLIDFQSDIIQLDGNDSVISETEINNDKSIKGQGKFRIIEANVNSLKGKKEDIQTLIEDENPDCLVLVETKLDDSYKNAEFFDNNVWNVVIREDRNCYGGGIIVAVRRKFTVSPVIIKYDDPSQNPELYWIKLHTFDRRKTVYICGFYRSQRDSRSENTIKCLQESLQKLPGKDQHVVIIGDANLHIDWDNNRPHQNSFTKPLDREMLEICSDFDLV